MKNTFRSFIVTSLLLCNISPTIAIPVSLVIEVLNHAGVQVAGFYRQKSNTDASTDIQGEITSSVQNDTSNIVLHEVLKQYPSHNIDITLTVHGVKTFLLGVCRMTICTTGTPAWQVSYCNHLNGPNQYIYKPVPGLDSKKLQLPLPDPSTTSREYRAILDQVKQDVGKYATDEIYARVSQNQDPTA